MTSQSSSITSTFILVLVFVFGSGIFLFYRWNDPMEDKVNHPTPLEEIDEQPEEILDSTEAKRVQKSQDKRNAFWKEMNNENFTAFQAPRTHPAHGIYLLLDAQSQEEDLMNGVQLLNNHTPKWPDVHSQLVSDLEDAGDDYITRRDLLLAYLHAEEKRILLLKSILGNTIRIVRFAQERKIPYEGEPWPLEPLPEDEPEDEALYHQDIDPDEIPLPAGLPSLEDFQPIELIPPRGASTYESDVIFED